MWPGYAFVMFLGLYSDVFGWQIGMTSLMSIPPLNLVDFSFMEYVFPVADLENEYG
ncbi:unnamed protein product [Arabidopsis thaliana]|uniref:(thale cress) hypothetical protein n=1 Tax=Arabidopsis thaliana TaxID=3702 RepID=A0A7G2FBH4_ARATH|nr:unnamed protein product [Arabidopsis thaliana]